MAKLSRKVAFKNATINMHDMTLTEYGKENYDEFNLISILKAWDGVDGVSLTISLDEDMHEDQGVPVKEDE